MTLKKISTSETLLVGEYVVMEGYNSIRGVKLLKRVYVEEVGKHVWLTQQGRVVNNAWKADEEVEAYKPATLVDVYDQKWTPDKGGVDAKPGDVLVDQDGVYFFVASLSTVWSLKNGTQTSLERWQKKNGYGNDWDGRQFTVKNTAAGGPYSKFVKAESTL